MASPATRGQQTPGMQGILVPMRELEDKGPTDRPLGECTALSFPGAHFNFNFRL